MQQGPYKDSVTLLQQRYDSLNQQKLQSAQAYVQSLKTDGPIDTAVARFQQFNKRGEEYRAAFRELSQKAVNKKGEDANFVFLSFVKNYLPQGLKGLLIAIIFLAAWGSIAAALNSLAASTVVDFHQRFRTDNTPLQEYRIAKWYTLGWGVFSVLVAEFAHNLGQSLIETVNILGSLFYGVILGIFLVAFYLKKAKGTATFIAALVVEAFIVILFFKNSLPLVSGLPDVSFLWLNAIGAIGVVMLAYILQLILPSAGANKVSEKAME
jgi:Na+/proline symporter